jgi:hypothetical protein
MGIDCATSSGFGVFDTEGSAEEPSGCVDASLFATETRSFSLLDFRDAIFCCRGLGNDSTAEGSITPSFSCRDVSPSSCSDIDEVVSENARVDNGGEEKKMPPIYGMQATLCKGKCEVCRVKLVGGEVLIGTKTNITNMKSDMGGEGKWVGWDLQAE